MERVLRLLIVVWISLIPRHALFAERLQDAADTTATMEKTFQWFDTLGYTQFREPPVRQCRTPAVGPRGN